MATVDTRQDTRVKVCPVEDLERDGFRVVTAEGRTVLVLMDQGNVYALDNRCPHMGFPLHRGTVRDGILTCHWHHAKFDLAGGCTFDPFSDDVTAFNVEVRDGLVWLDPRPIEEERTTHWLKKLDEGLKHNIQIVQAKSVIGLAGADTSRDILEKVSLFTVHNRAAGWSTGLSILTAMANVLPHLDEEDRPLAIYQGVTAVARGTAGQPPSFDLDPLQTSETSPERYADWFRRFVELRSSDSAERALRTAIHIGLTPRTIADMVFTACTDHLFRGGGHSLDFASKGFELLDHIGWEHAEEVLPALLPGDNMVAALLPGDNMVAASRMEESSSWRHPVDLASLLNDLYAELDGLVDRGDGRWADWDGHRDLAETVLDATPEEDASRVPGSGVRGRGSGERETTASSLAGKQQAREKEDNSGQGKDGPAGAIAQGGNGR